MQFIEVFKSINQIKKCNRLDLRSWHWGRTHQNQLKAYELQWRRNQSLEHQSLLSALVLSIKEANCLWRLFNCSLSCFRILWISVLTFTSRGCKRSLLTCTRWAPPYLQPNPLVPQHPWPPLSPKQTLSVPLCFGGSGHGSRLHSLSQTMPGGGSSALAEGQPARSRGWWEESSPMGSSPGWQLLAHAGRHDGGEDTTQKDPSALIRLRSTFIHTSGVGLGW